MDIIINFFTALQNAFLDLVPSFLSLLKGEITDQDTISLLGFFAGLLTTYGLVPQVIQVIRTKDTQAISLKMYIIFCIGISFWLLFGIAINNVWVQLWNILSLIFSSIILTYKVREVVLLKE